MGNVAASEFENNRESKEMMAFASAVENNGEGEGEGSTSFDANTKSTAAEKNVPVLVVDALEGVHAAEQERERALRILYSPAQEFLLVSPPMKEEAYSAWPESTKTNPVQYECGCVCS